MVKKFFLFLVGLCFCIGLGGAEKKITLFNQESPNQELCLFAEEVFSVLYLQQSEKKADLSRLTLYQDALSEDIQELAKAVIHSFKETENDDVLEKSVSSLGRLFKCSVDNEQYRNASTPFTLHRIDLLSTVNGMNELLGKEVPDKGTNFHKLMIESMADKRFDLALYSYIKIAESRCKQT